ncbi:hypothetical protein MMSR116_11585 [Methylobacterium mesophilicum SR1.6/6]|uniref:Uncharacterized protein n=1 Tax=Methylobacterium mesophilicum SR1.6/6 TaxID=908290 RepID=A0A6B9FIQ0_9HYPH|nr:DUF5682 family protein [Methylobacterium mesophilicum]QGY02440.1 hypothetical protein MMSR116_11585 [Methylobacterium mesophilicum SR1.6/6]
MPDIRLFGIRHHGPGSARSLAAALDAFVPDCVLIEGPPDADSLIPLAAQAGMAPPVAILVYRPDRPRDCAFFPFAGFSPEWVALRHGIAAGAAVRFIDLPHAIQLADGFGKPAEEDSAEAVPGEAPDGAGPPGAAVASAEAASAALRRDPLGELAQAAGYPDGERWWDAFVESRSGTDADVFAAIGEAMAALRATTGPEPRETGSEPDAREEAREAHMRGAIRRAGRDGFARIAVVCGAWHVPALARHDARGQSAADAATLKGLPKTKVASAWAPWSYERLATASGYRAGVLSPEWYDTLWNHGEQIASRWLARAAALLRAEDLDASPASVIEAARLADALAGLRGRARPSLEDLDEAAQATLCFADPAPMALIRRKLVIGERLGATPPDSPGTPVEMDFARACKSLCLKPGSDAGEIVLDLRKETDLARSRFLNRLALLGIPWGTRRTARGRGTFKEAWFLSWQPEWVVDLVAASADGGTVAEAAAAQVTRRAKEATRVADLAALIGTLLDADLAEATAAVIGAIEDRAALSADVFDLMEALPPLAELGRYGSVRSADTAPVRAAVRGLVPRAAAGLVAACQSLDDDAAAAAKARIAAVTGALALLDDPELTGPWREALGALADQEHVHGRVVGRAVRLLFDARVLDAAQAGARLGRALSRAASAAAAAAWIEGFLEDSGTALLHGQDLLAVLDDWLCALDEEHFTELLPLVRRTFATTPPAERRAIGTALGNPGRAGAGEALPGRFHDAARAATVMPILRLLFAPVPAESGLETPEAAP